MSTKQAARGRKTRKTRTAPTVQVSTNYFNNSTNENSLTERRVQQVISMAGVAPWYARIIASLAFGGVA